jgi:hypothetical protein
LADNSNLPSQYHTSHHSTAPAYININAQITKLLGRWEIYFGGENLTNYVQHSPIIASEEPYSSYFNASQVWGPLMGIRGFVGVRYSITQEEAKKTKKLLFTDLTKAKTEIFEVKGDCGMCKTRIEKAAAQAGATTANWSSETHFLTTRFDEKQTSKAKIQAAIAKVGHETEGFKVDKKVYDALPACCQYKQD